MKLLICMVPLLLLTACKEAYDRESTYCSIDAPVSGVVLLATQDFSVSGWAFDELSNSSPEHVRVQFTSTNGQVSKIFEGNRGTKRPDVVKAFNKLGAEMSGFNLNVPANSLVPGKYKVVILQDMPKYAVICDKNYIYEVVEKVTPVQPPVAPNAAVNAPPQPPVAPNAAVNAPPQPSVAPNAAVNAPPQPPVAPNAAVNAPSKPPVTPAKKSHIRHKKTEHTKE